MGTHDTNNRGRTAAGPSSELLAAICQASPDVVLVVDARGCITYVNDRCPDLLGYAPHELVGRMIEVLVPSETIGHGDKRQDYTRAPVARHMGGHAVLSARHKSGARIPVDVSLSPLPAIDGHGALVQAVVRDATPRRSFEEELLIRSVALDAAANGIVITDAKGTILWVNPAATRMTGYSRDELVGAHTRLLKSGEHDKDFYRELWETVTAGRTWYGEMANRRKDGSIYYEEQHIAPVRGPDGELQQFIAIKQDVTKRKRAEAHVREANKALTQQLAEIETLHEKLRELAVRDGLTGLFNRRYLDETLVREVARARRERQVLSAVMIDVDGFKQVNDSNGHAAGDAVLVGLAELLRGDTRVSDIACRFGGDEFLVILPAANLAQARTRAEVWRARFGASQAGRQPACSLSAGVAALQNGDDAQSLIRRADKALYAAKNGGRDKVVGLE